MNNREIIYESLRIIEENLRTGMSVQELSDKLGFSVYYFIRLFRGITGYSPKSYIQKRKITEAAAELAGEDRRIIDVALDFGFGTPESFSRAFQKHAGFNPAQLRTGVKLDSDKVLPPLSAEQLEFERSIPIREPELIDFGPLHLIGMPLYYQKKPPGDLSEPWNTFLNNIGSMKNRIRPEKYYQVQYWFQNQEFNSIFFFLAVEVEPSSEIPIQFTAKTLPAQKYLRFFHKGLSSRVGHTYRYIYNTYLPDTDYKLPHLFNFEYYPPDHRGSYDENSVSEIYIPVSV